MAAVGRFLLLVALVASPWVFGCVQPWPQLILGAVIAGLSVLRLVEAFIVRPDQSVHIPLAAAAPLVLLLIAAFQLLPQDSPLPARMHHAVYARDAELFTTEQHIPSGTLSASDTRREAARLYFALAAFVLAAQWFADPSTHRALLGGLALNGAALGAFGIIQRLSWNGLLFWSVPLRYGGTPFASYVNRNNAAGYLNLCLGAAIGLSVLIWWQPTAGHVRLPRWQDRVRLKLAQLDGWKLCTGSLLIVTTAGVLFSLSRGGIVALAVAAVVVIFAGVRGASRGGMILLSVAILAAAVGLVSFTGQFEMVDERIDTLADPLAAATGRLQHWSETFGAVRDFPMLGSGLGTYHYANLPYQARPSHAWYYNADNQWFEILVEAGAVGLVAVFCGFVLVGCCSLLLLRRGDPQSRAIGACGLFVVLTQAIQSITDFGLLLPANGVTFAVLCGAVCGSACHLTQFERIRIPLWLSLAQLDGRFAQGLLSLVVAAAGGAFALELYTATMAESAREQTVEVEADRTPVAALNESIGRLQHALSLRPDDDRVHLELGRIWARRCQVQLYQQLLGEIAAADGGQKRQLWSAASVSALGTRARRLAAAGNSDELQRLQRLSVVRENLLPAREHLQLALQNGPLSRGAENWLSRIEPLTGDTDLPAARQTLVKARFVAPSSPDELFELAALADISGEHEFAADCWRRGLQFDPEEAPEVWRELLLARTPEQALETAVPERVDVLVEIAESEDDPGVRQTIADRADRVLNQQNSSATALSRARLDELQLRPEQAIHNYRLALSDDRRDTSTRLKLARLLIRQGRISEAVTEYSLLRQQLPNRKDIEKELAALMVRELESTDRPSDPDNDQSTSRSPVRTGQ